MQDFNLYLPCLIWLGCKDLNLPQLYKNKLSCCFNWAAIKLFMNAPYTWGHRVMSPDIRRLKKADWAVSVKAHQRIHNKLRCQKWGFPLGPLKPPSGFTVTNSWTSSWPMVSFPWKLSKLIMRSRIQSVHQMTIIHSDIGHCWLAIAVLRLLPVPFNILYIAPVF